MVSSISGVLKGREFCEARVDRRDSVKWRFNILNDTTAACAAARGRRPMLFKVQTLRGRWSRIYPSETSDGMSEEQLREQKVARFMLTLGDPIISTENPDRCK
jgi:hypothetical protein